MARWIGLLRGINVGGAHRLPMAELRDELEGLGLASVRTYIQSGNVVFESAHDEPPETLAGRIETAIEARHGFRPRVLVLSATRFRGAMHANPVPEGEAEPKTLHLFFLAGTPGDVDLSAFRAIASATERFHLGDGVFYLLAPDGIGRSKLATRAEVLLGVPATARNWRTVTKVWEMVNGPD